MDPTLQPDSPDNNGNLAGQPAAPRENRKRSLGCLGFFVGLLVPVALGLLALALMPKAKDGAGTPKERVKAMVNAWRGVTPEPEIIVKVEEKIVEVEKLVPAPPPPPPSKWVPRKNIDTATLYNGLVTSTKLNEVEGRGATIERADDSSYGVEIEVKITIPSATDTMEGLAAINPDLPKALPGLPAIMEKAAVSGFYHQLYDNKRKRVQASYTRLDKVLDRHNFYDCETILELKSPDTGRRVLLLQSEMDVVSDGTDGDRIADLDTYVANSPNFQPSTSYMWRKKTVTPNPLLPRYTDAVARDVELLKKPGITSAEKRSLNAKLKINRLISEDLKAWSYLIAEADPFVVIPLFIPLHKRNTPYAPTYGDYAVVVYGDRLFPAIIGDAGPTYKTGEGSLRLCQEMNPKSTVYSRPESDLEVTYLFFPGTAEKEKDAPDLKLWHQRCSTLVQEIGGIGEGYELHQWEDRFAPEPTPVPTPTVAPAQPAGVTPEDILR